jgi:parallel beta-helix repeat protein
MSRYWIFFSLILAITTLSCNRTRPFFSDPEIDTEVYNSIQEQLLDAKPGDVIQLPEGFFEFDRPFSLDGIPGVTIAGAGTDKTILSFRMQKTGAEGIKITADSVTLRDFTVQDTPGDAIKLQDCTGVTLLRLKTTWSRGADADNGGYGLYPVACTGVLIDSCEASYASDAGIYVGQSRDVIVRNCFAHGNVAGIEIENCINSEVYDNRAEHNTGGILVFDLPDLPQVNGHTCRIYRNTIKENNHSNFAPAGNIVGIVPPGTGIILLAAKNVEIFDNDITGHKTIGTAIASYQITEKIWADTTYNPYTYDIAIYDNRYQRKRALPDLSRDFGKMVNILFAGKPQDILYDGIIDTTRTAGPNPMNICIRQEQTNLRFANIDAANSFDKVNKDISPYQTCEGRELPVQ